MRPRTRKIAALLAAAGLAVAALAPAANADQPKFNPGQKGNVCGAPGPNSNPHCVPR
jgi:hypothetical protein